jgi:hypothetical protein
MESAMGRPKLTNKPDSMLITVKMPTTVVEQVAAEAVRDDRSRASVIRRIVVNHYASQGDAKG